MPNARTKLKSHRGATKRFKLTAKGKVKAKRAGNRHLLTKKSSKGKRQKRELATLNKTNSDRITKVIDI